MLKSAAKVSRYTAGMSFEDFLADERTVDAVVRNLEIIGEAAKNVPLEVRERYRTHLTSLRSCKPLDHEPNKAKIELRGRIR